HRALRERVEQLVFSTDPDLLKALSGPNVNREQKRMEAETYGRRFVRARWVSICLLCPRRGICIGRGRARGIVAKHTRVGAALSAHGSPITAAGATASTFILESGSLSPGLTLSLR